MYDLSKKDPSYIEKFKAHCNLLVKLKRKARLEYDKQKFEDYDHDKSKTWRHINEIMKRKRNSKSSIKNIRNKEGNLVCNTTDIANCLNEHFSTVGKNMASKFENAENSEQLKDPLDYISKRVDSSLEFSDTTTSEILDIILAQDSKKSCGYDEINNKIIKKTSNVVTPFLKILFNACMKQGVFPECFKLAQVTPLFKGGEKTNLGSYRPISLLPALSKILEKIILVRMMSFLSENDVIAKEQFGFRPKYTTEYAILDIYEKLINNVDNSLTSCAIFLDLAKAFDTVSHDILLWKLEAYGMRNRELDFSILFSMTVISL